MGNKNNQVISLGCRLNIFESEVIKSNLKETGAKNTIVVNTCTVTQEAHKQSMKMVRKLRKENPNSTIIVTGCGVQIDTDGYLKMPEVNRVIDNYNKLSVSAILGLNETNQNNTKEITTVVGDASKTMEIPTIQGFSNRTRAFVQIQQGCDHRCTFCIIYKARGQSKSLPAQDIINQVQQAIAFGHKDITLTGVDISSWQRNVHSDEKSKLGELCKEILSQAPKLDRLRLSSLDPAVEDTEILNLLKTEKRFMPSLHLSIQSMNNAVLKNMGRRHSKESATKWISKIRNANPNVVLGADIIAGFPRETEEQHLETYGAIKDLKIPFLHVFPYSERVGTVATKMKSIPINIRKKRAKDLINLGKQIKSDLFSSKIGSIVDILVEGKNSGYTEDYCLCKIRNAEVNKKEIIQAKVIAVENYTLIVDKI